MSSAWSNARARAWVAARRQPVVRYAEMEAVAWSAAAEEAARREVQGVAWSAADAVRAAWLAASAAAAAEAEARAWDQIARWTLIELASAPVAGVSCAPEPEPELREGECERAPSVAAPHG